MQYVQANVRVIWIVNEWWIIITFDFYAFVFWKYKDASTDGKMDNCRSIQNKTHTMFVIFNKWKTDWNFISWIALMEIWICIDICSPIISFLVCSSPFSRKKNVYSLFFFTWYIGGMIRNLQNCFKKKKFYYSSIVSNYKIVIVVLI